MAAISSSAEEEAGERCGPSAAARGQPTASTRPEKTQRAPAGPVIQALEQEMRRATEVLRGQGEAAGDLWLTT